MRTTAHDATSNNDTGTITGATWTSGKINSGLSFNGTSNYVSMGTPAALQLGTNSFTVISWFKTSSTVGAQRMVSMGDYNWTNGYLTSVGPYPTVCVGCVGGSIGGGTQANSLMFFSNTSFNDGNWHQAAMVINQTIGTAQIYIDGVARAVTTGAGTCGTASGTTVDISACTSLNASGTTPFTVGSYSGTNEFFNGSLDEPRIYGSPLSNQEVLSQYTNDVNALSEYATNASFSGTVGRTTTYTLPIAIGYQLTPAPGWSLSITSTTLTSGANTLPTTASTLSSVSNTCTSTCTPTTMTNTISSFPMPMPAAATAPLAVNFFGTIAGSGTGTYTITPTISVTIPITAKTGAYSSTITLTAATGP